MSGQRESSPGTSETSSSTDNEENDPVESLVSGRVKRATAGQRLSLLVSKEQDDEIELLFAEDELEADHSFDEDEENEEDADLGSSSDEEDAQEAQGNEDMAGEQELQQQARQETKKRKAKAKARVSGLTKRVKIDPTAIRNSSQSQTRPKKKKSERVSWLASEADAPTRISSRKHTVQNRETVHKRLADGEKQRRKLMQQMEEAQKRKQARKPKALTQSQRLEEASKIEKKNAKSLNRWEESEKQRLVEQKAKLDALHDRQLCGPVISWWSGIERLVENKVVSVGITAIRDSGHIEDPIKPMSSRSPPPSAAQEPMGSVSAHAAASAQVSLSGSSSQSKDIGLPSSSSSQPSFLAGIHAYAALPYQRNPATMLHPQGMSPHQSSGDPERTAFATADHSQAREITSMKEYQSRNLVALKNIDANAQKVPEGLYESLPRKSKTKLSKPVTEQCAITGQQARFREPQTGLPYANGYAYKELVRLRRGQTQWSEVLECYIGGSSSPARGVPDHFLERPG